MYSKKARINKNIFQANQFNFVWKQWFLNIYFGRVEHGHDWNHRINAHHHRGEWHRRKNSGGYLYSAGKKKEISIHGCSSSLGGVYTSFLIRKIYNKLELARFSAELRIQDGAECGKNGQKCLVKNLLVRKHFGKKLGKKYFG